MRQLGSSIRRRSLLKTGAAATGFAAAGLLPAGGFAQAKTQTVNLQLGWLAGNNQIGEVAAKHLGYFEEEKLNVVIHPGGPSIDGVAIVASGRHDIGQVSSSPSLMLAASQKIPVMCFATGLQQHPYAYFSLPKKPVPRGQGPCRQEGRHPGDRQGPLERADEEARHRREGRRDRDHRLGDDADPDRPDRRGERLDHQHHDLEAARSRPHRSPPVGRRRAALCAALLRHQDHDREEARDAGGLRPRRLARLGICAEESRQGRDLLVKEYSNLNLADEIEGSKVLLTFAFNANTQANGWGAFDPAIWQEQIALYDDLKQFSAGAPKLEDVITTKILEATKGARAKVG